jgi:tetrahydromethanopterin S-methyltransferase subunit E
MVYFQTKKSQFGQILEGLGMGNVVIFLTIWNILWPFGIIYGRSVYFVVICHILLILVCLDQEKSGNSG